MIRVEPVETVRLRLVEREWAFATQNRAAIGRHWQSLLTAKPGLWNGRALLCVKAVVADRVLDAELAEIDYASFVAWRDWGWPDSGVCNCFGVPAVFSSDGALLFGIMAEWTLNAAMAYPPSGSLEPRDVMATGAIDLRGNMRTELLEETGLDLDRAHAGETLAIFEGPRLAIVQRHDFRLSFTEMEEHFHAHVEAEAQPELAAIEAVRHGAQADSRMPGYAREIIRYFFS